VEVSNNWHLWPDLLRRIVQGREVVQMKHLRVKGPQAKHQTTPGLHLPPRKFW